MIGMEPTARALPGWHGMKLTTCIVRMARAGTNGTCRDGTNCTCIARMAPDGIRMLLTAYTLPTWHRGDIGCTYICCKSYLQECTGHCTTLVAVPDTAADLLCVQFYAKAWLRTQFPVE
ncbi:hypothetical protein NDU88_002332 [Pleurodeles waltl]|uniref:Uncharacterized protein n=1 Tax=Pleurodeles waltl TaxID=8319 RepID=A0AAV7QBE2_PLEWA|nr:hypothetical protein NDU88_002332 [Pleurodeles waltl]